MSNKKKIIFLAVFIVATIIFTALIYFVFIKNPVSQPKNNSNSEVNANANIILPISNQAINSNRPASVNSSTNRIIGISNQAVNGVSEIAKNGPTIAKQVEEQGLKTTDVIATKDGIKFYDKAKGRFYTIDQSGKVHELSDKDFPEAEGISWSPQGDKAIVSFPDQSKIMYDFTKGRQVTLPKEWDDIKFSNTGEQIGFKNMSDNESERWLAVAKPDGSAAKLIEPLGKNADKVEVNWSPTGQVVATFADSRSGSAQEIFLVGLNGENFKSIEVEGRGFRGKWSPSGDQILYSVFTPESNYRPNLYLVDSSGDNIGAEKIPLNLHTWPERCAFSKEGSNLYCAVPSYLEEGVGLFPDLAVNTNDRIYRIDPNTGSKVRIAIPVLSTGSSNYTVNKLFLSSDERTLYLSDENSGNLYEIKLK